MAAINYVNLRGSWCSKKGGRKYMEDVAAIKHKSTPEHRQFSYYAVFDGHGGPEAALYAKNFLMEAIITQPGFYSDNDEIVLNAIRKGFKATQEEMWEDLVNWAKTDNGLPSTSGMTASIIFVRKNKLFIGHVGDSRIVVGFGGRYSDS